MGYMSILLEQDFPKHYIQSDKLYGKKVGFLTHYLSKGCMYEIGGHSKTMYTKNDNNGIHFYST